MLPPFGLSWNCKKGLCAFVKSKIIIETCWWCDYTLGKLVQKSSVKSYNYERYLDQSGLQIYTFRDPLFLFLFPFLNAPPPPLFYVSNPIHSGCCWFNAWLKSLRERSKVAEDNPLDMQWKSTVVFVRFLSLLYLFLTSIHGCRIVFTFHFILFLFFSLNLHIYWSNYIINEMEMLPHSKLTTRQFLLLLLLFKHPDCQFYTCSKNAQMT